MAIVFNSLFNRRTPLATMMYKVFEFVIISLEPQRYAVDLLFFLDWVYLLLVHSTTFETGAFLEYYSVLHFRILQSQ